MGMVKIENDKYYTPPKVAKKLIDLTFDYLIRHNLPITDIIEPSAGNGSFSNQMDCTAYDLIPQNPNIIQADFLTEPIPYKKGRLCIGNPPFGIHNSLSVKFYKKCCKIGDYIGFILPISQFKNSPQLYEFDLVKSLDLGILSYSGIKLHCCYNLYIRPKTNKTNPKPSLTFKDITIKEYRRDTNKGYHIPPGWDYALCTWGQGSFGKIPSQVGQYSMEMYIWVHNKRYLKQIGELLEYNTIRRYVQSISATKMSKMKLSQYLKDNIPELK